MTRIYASIDVVIIDMIWWFDMVIWWAVGNLKCTSSGHIRWHSFVVGYNGTLLNVIHASMISWPNHVMDHEQGFMRQLAILSALMTIRWQVPRRSFLCRYLNWLTLKFNGPRARIYASIMVVIIDMVIWWAVGNLQSPMHLIVTHTTD